MLEYLKIFAIVFGINLMPAFGPPTWSILTLYKLKSNIPVVPLVLIGATAAAIGRLILAYSFRHLGGRFLPDQIKKNLEAARSLLERRKRHAVVGLALFALSPVPSAQLFEAAGFTRIRLVPLTAAFFIGRLVSYSIYASTASEIQESSIGDEFQRALTSPVGIALEVGMLVLLVGILRVDWTKRLNRISNGSLKADGKA